MRQATVSAIVIVVALAGCPGGGGSIGDRCEQNNECDSTLQCLGGVCEPRCQRAPECGDGYACDDDGLCRLSSGQRGDACTSEVDCSPGLSCQIDGTATDENERLRASCTEPNPTQPSGWPCVDDDECRNGTCALGQCVDLCKGPRDCGAGNVCMTIPRVEANGKMFEGCLISQGNIVFSIPVPGPSADVLLPVPSAAQFASLVFSVGDLAQQVGATRVFAPSGTSLYELPCNPASPAAQCTELQSKQTYFNGNKLRHLPGTGASVLAMPTSPEVPLETGAYRIKVQSLRANGTPGSSIPTVTAVIRIGSAVLLDLHFHFLDLDNHPCQSSFGNNKLDASSAQTETYFQNNFLGELRAILGGGGIALGTVTYRNVVGQPLLDGLDISQLGTLLALGTNAGGINVFFVRTLSPVGLQALGPAPGAAGIGGTRQSGIVIGVDTLCYREWPALARIAAHELARYMGLHHNVEIETGANGAPMWRDPINDSDDTQNNLMFYSEHGGTALSAGQRDILTRSPVLR